MSAATFQTRHPGLIWCNPRPSEVVLIRAALLRPRFHTILDACLEFSLESVQREWSVLQREAGAEIRRVEAETVRILRHIAEGFADAQTGH